MKAADSPAKAVSKAEAKAKREHLEKTFALQCRAANLHPTHLFKIPGLNYEWDYCFREHLLLIELQGGTQQRPVKIGEKWYIPVSGHNSMSGIQRDAAKNNAAVSRHWNVFYFTADDVLTGRALKTCQEYLANNCPF